MHILVIEDEEKVARFIKKGLEAEHYTVTIVRNGIKGEQAALSGPYDLIILDVLLPDIDGFQILRTMRNEKKKTPVLMLTARSTTEDIVQGLELGADDYLTKPFAFDELLARIRTLLRRNEETKIHLRVGDLQLDTVAHTAHRYGKAIELTSREYTLLEFFMRRPNTLIERQELAEIVWGYDLYPGTNIIDVYINRLRRKVDAKSRQKLFYTIRKKGYILSERGKPKKRIG